MRGVIMYGPGDVRVEQRAKPTILQPTDAVLRLSATCVCGSDLWPYRGTDEVSKPTPMGHEYVGVVEEVGSAVTTVAPGQFVIGSFAASDNTCPICRAGYQSSCERREWPGAGGAQAEYLRVPLADGTLVATPELPSEDLLPSLLAASDVLGTGWFGAVAAEAGPGKTVAVVGDGAVGLLGVMAAQQLGAERIIAMSRHADRQKLAIEFGATDIVVERGNEGVAAVKELTGGYGAHSVIEAVGTQESMMQAIRATRPGGHVGYVGVAHGVSLPGEELFFSGVHLHGGPAPVRRFLPDLIDRIWNRQINPGQGVRPHPAPRAGRAGLPGDGPAHRHQGPAHPLTMTRTTTSCPRRRSARPIKDRARHAGHCDQARHPGHPDQPPNLLLPTPTRPNPEESRWTASSEVSRPTPDCSDHGHHCTRPGSRALGDPAPADLRGVVPHRGPRRANPRAHHGHRADHDADHALAARPRRAA